LGQGLWHDGQLTILGAPTGLLSVVWPALVGGPLSLGNFIVGYRVLLSVEPLLMSLAAIPAYLWARSLGGRRWAVAAAALTLAIPSLGYSSFVMTEVAFYPLGALAAWAMAAAIEAPTLRRQGVVVATIAVATATRLQGVVLVPVFLTSVALDAVLARNLHRVLRLAAAVAALTTLSLGWVGWRLLSGGGWSASLGGYRAATGGYDAQRAA